MTAQKPKLIVFPGIDGSPELRQGLADCLDPTLEVQIVALPDDVSLDYEGLAVRFAALLPDGPVVLAGESFSGPLVAMLAERCPEKVRGVIFIASFPKLTYLRAAKYLLPFIPFRAIPYDLVGWIMMGSKGKSDIPRRMRMALKQLPSKVAKHRAKLPLEVDVSRTVSRLPQPILVIHGRKDRLITQAHVFRFLKLRPDAHVAWIDGHHMILETHPEPIARSIEAFIEALPPPSSA
ncbi:alpha/beta fold hydrolase [Microvirga solisilvae]|uniref:alpha/beta fold hydrolase n=1 Tax=Microvirga solisilvae TaxID=2919498 RepID=UPI001FAF7493|nr:alpha/beta hydrolase [Microvirga solisilvae]